MCGGASIGLTVGRGRWLAYGTHRPPPGRDSPSRATRFADLDGKRFDAFHEAMKAARRFAGFSMMVCRHRHG